MWGFFIEQEKVGVTAKNFVWHFPFMKVLTIIIWCITLFILYLYSKLKNHDK